MQMFFWLITQSVLPNECLLKQVAHSFPFVSKDQLKMTKEPIVLAHKLPCGNNFPSVNSCMKSASKSEVFGQRNKTSRR